VRQDNPRILILDDLLEKGRLLSRILISKGYSANSLTYSQNGLDEIEKERPDLSILDLDFSEASIIRILQKVRENNPSLPIFICSDSVTEQFKNQATRWDASVFFPKADVEQVLNQMKMLSPNNKERGIRQPSREERKVKKGGEKRWQSKRTSALPA
jgi:DNA-binding response OmpR family regulator